MTELKTVVEIDEALWRDLVDQNNKMMALSQFIDKVIEQGQRQQQMIQQAASDTWRKLEEKGLDIRNYGWAPDTKVPVVRLTHILHPK